MASETTMMGKGGNVCRRELPARDGHRAARTQEQILAAALSTVGLADLDEDDEVPSVEIFIQVVPNGSTEEIDALESLDCLLSSANRHPETPRPKP